MVPGFGRATSFAGKMWGASRDVRGEVFLGGFWRFFCGFLVVFWRFLDGFLEVFWKIFGISFLDEFCLSFGWVLDGLCLLGWSFEIIFLSFFRVE